MSTEFCIRIILPVKIRADDVVGHGQSILACDLIDDDPNQPLFLAEACSIFAAKGIQFEVTGFFKKPLPVSTAEDLVYLLESLPSLLCFFENDNSNKVELGFWGQGVETVFAFSKLDGKIIGINCSSKGNFTLEKKTETISHFRLLGQVLAVVDVYREALKLFFPQVLDAPWNENVFIRAARLKHQILEE